jgi:hypothetical protein
MIEAAIAADDDELVQQLRVDQAFCAVMRRRLRRIAKRKVSAAAEQVALSN